MKSPNMVRAGVDWLTMTVRAPEVRVRLGKDMASQLISSQQGGLRITTWTWKGYRGWTDGEISYGERLEDDIAVFRGAVANEHWFHYVGYARNVSRFDLAVTCTLRKPCEELAEDGWNEIQRMGASQALPRAYTFIKQLNGGSTLYVGKRTSEEYGRLYDKSAQSLKAPFGLEWRYEVELKGERAKQASSALRAEKNVSERITGFVYAWFKERLVQPVFGAGAFTLSMEREANLRSSQITLAWLHNQVRPAILRLIQEGQSRAVRDALQLEIWPEEILKKGGNSNGS